MKKSDLMLLYEVVTKKPSTRVITDGVHPVGIEIWHYDFINWLSELAFESVLIKPELATKFKEISKATE